MNKPTQANVRQILFACLMITLDNTVPKIGIQNQPLLLTAGDLGVADSDGRTALRNAGQNLVALLDVEDRRSRGRSLHPVLRVGCTSKSDSTEVSEGYKGPVLLEVLYQGSACGIISEATTKSQTSTIHSAFVSQSVPSTPPVNVWVTVLPLVLLVMTALPEVVEAAVTVRVTLSPAEKEIPLKS
jgi:hypothetical protein